MRFLLLLIMEIDDEKFEEVKKQAEEFYKTIGTIKCPYLKTNVHFNTEGFEHLLSKSWNRGRSRVEQYTRLRLLPLAVRIIAKTATLQEFDERKIFVRQKINSRWEKRLKAVTYYVFIAVIRDHNVRLKVIVKEIEGGIRFFHSLYPSWKVTTDGNGHSRKVFYSGNPEDD